MSTFGAMSDGFKDNIFTGGGVRSKCWLSIVADVLGIDGAVSANTDAALGAAMLAGVGAGVFSNLEEAMSLSQYRDFYIKYSREYHEIYNDLFYRYKRLKEACDKYLQ
jgi:sugar (pentulose or hexulose) kinase